MPTHVAIFTQRQKERAEYMLIDNRPANGLAQLRVQPDADVADAAWFATVTVEPCANLLRALARFNPCDATCLKVKDNILCIEYLG